MLSAMEHFFFGRAQSWLAVLALAALVGCSGQDPAATRSQADGSFSRGDFKAAAIQYKNVLQEAPADPLARVGLGRALLAQGDVDGAAIELDRARADGAEPALFAPWHAAALVEQAEFRRVVQTYGDTRLEDPEAQARLMVEVARAWGGLRNAARTERALNDALAVLPDYPAAKVLLARLKGSKGDLDGAEQLADALVKSNPDRFDVWSLRADLHQTRGREAEALAAYERVIELRPTHMQSHVAVLRSRLRAGDSKAADAQLARMQKLAPRHPVTMLVDAELALSKGETVRAREVSQQLLRLFPDDIGILLVAGSAESALGSIVQAAAHFGKALARDPELDIARENIAAGQIRLGQYGKALETLQPLLARERGTPRGLALAGEAYMRSGRPDAAEPLFRRAVQLAPDEAKLQAAALSARLMSGGGGPVLAQLTDLAQRTDGIDAELALYAAHMSRRNGAAALEAVAAMARKRPQDASVDEMRGTAHRLLGDRAAARNAYEAALKKDPKLFAALAATVELDMAESRLKQAEDTLRKVIAGEAQHAEALLLLAAVRERAGAEPAEMGKLLADAVAADRRSAPARLRQIGYALERRQFKEAQAAAQDALAALPGDTRILEAAGLAQLRAGAVEQAASTFGQLAAARPDDARPLVQLAGVYRVQRREDQAEAAYRRAIELPVGRNEAVADYVDYLLSANKPDAALQTARRLRESRPSRPEGYAVEALVHTRLRRVDDAIRVLQLGLVNAPSSELAVMLHGSLVSRGAEPEASRVARDWLQRHPADSRMRYEVAIRDLVGGRLSQAEAGLRQVVEANPRNVLAVHTLAHVLIGLGKREALGFAERAAALAPDDVAVLDTLASAQAAAGRQAEALETQRRAVAMAPEDMVLRLGLARIALQGGDKATAREEIERLRKLGTAFPNQAEVESLAQKL